MKSLFSHSEEIYDGSQLRSLFNYLGHGLLGDSIVAWIGPCAVALDHMVDGEDLRAQAKIEGAQMVHFIIEMFDCNLLAAVSLQRLFASTVEVVLRRISRNDSLARGLRREGDDLFVDERKLSISIATVSPLSALIHFAVNVTNEGTPVTTLSLQDLQASPQDFALETMNGFCQEFGTIRDATVKVKWVK